MTSDRVIVVDDDEGMLRMMAMALQRRGYLVESASSSRAALEMIQSQGPFSVLVTDLMMPDLSGLDLLQAARQRDADIEVVIITAGGTLDTAISALRDGGAFDYLLKPLESMKQLALSVDRAIAHRRLNLERKALQQKVQEEAERLQALVANTGDAILSAGPDDTLTIVNPAAARLLGRSDLVGKPALANLPPALASLIANWQAVGRQYPAIIEIPWEDRTQQMVRLSPLNNQANELQGWVMVLQDITHLKRIDELKAQRLAEAAQKIQLPLAQAMNALVRLNTLSIPDERLSEAVYRLNKVWGHIQEWADSLLSLVRVDSTVPHPARFPLQPVLDKLLTVERSGMVSRKRISLQTSLSPDLPEVLADPALLQQLLGALLNRAVLRSAPGGVIRLKTRRQSSQVLVSISDEGPEVSEPDLPHIFEKSFISPNTGALNGGLELATVKAILDRMGGQVWLGGEGPRGSTVVVCLPAVAHQPESPRWQEAACLQETACLAEVTHKQTVAWPARRA